MAPQLEPKSCGVLLVTGQPVRSFLLMKHADRWDLPKGHVDPGETETDCALREMEEETGIPRGAVQLDPEFRYTQQYLVPGSRYGGEPDERLLKTLVIFLGRIDSERDVNLTEHAGCKWFPWAPPHRIQERTIDPLLAAVEEFLESRSNQTASRHL